MTASISSGVLWISVLIAVAAPRAEAGDASSSADLDRCGAANLPAARAKARRLVRQIRADLATVEDQIRRAPFIADVEAGRASLALVTAVVTEEFSIVRSDINSFNQMTTRWDTPPGSHFFGDLASGEALALPLVIDFAATVGLDQRELAAYEPRPRSQTYPSRVAWIASNANRASAAASFLVNFAVFGDNMARIRDALVARYGFTADQVGFFTFFAEPIPNFENDATEVIATGLVEGACPVDVRRSARLLQAYELDFWLAASDPPGSPLHVHSPAH